MNKFRKFSGKISAETYLKWIVFGSALRLAPGGWRLAPLPRLNSITRNMCKTPLPFYILDPSKY